MPDEGYEIMILLLITRQAVQLNCLGCMLQSTHMYFICAKQLTRNYMVCITIAKTNNAMSMYSTFTIIINNKLQSDMLRLEISYNIHYTITSYK